MSKLITGKTAADESWNNVQFSRVTSNGLKVANKKSIDKKQTALVLYQVRLVGLLYGVYDRLTVRFFLESCQYFLFIAKKTRFFSTHRVTSI